MANQKQGINDKDARYSKIIPKIIGDLKDSCDPFIPINLDTIGFFLNDSDAISQELDSLPKTRELLIPHLESSDQFFRRQINYAKAYFIETGRVPSVSDFCRFLYGPSALGDIEAAIREIQEYQKGNS